MTAHGLERVDVGARPLSRYRGVAPDHVLDEAEALAGRLAGARVLHVNATSYGGGVAEILRALVPLMRGLGLDAEWRVVRADAAFYRATKRLHNALQGRAAAFGPREEADFLAASREFARDLDARAHDVVVVHDPQPLALPALAGRGRARWVWRSHIDTSAPDAHAWRFVRRFLADYDAAVFTAEAFEPPDLPVPRVTLSPPAIDPLAGKNAVPPRAAADAALARLGVDPERPVAAQVGRFDRWKDPVGVVTACRLAREAVPALQLVLAGSMAADDPEGREVLRDVERAADGDAHVRLLTDLEDADVAALQAGSDLVLQKSLREGFGLTVSEALWKGTPVVGGRAGGIPLQIEDGVGGVLVASIDECADAVVRLLRDRDGARELAARGRERVRERFLVPRLLRDHLRVVDNLLGDRGAGALGVSGP